MRRGALRRLPRVRRWLPRTATDGDMPAFARELESLRDTIAQNTHELARLLNEGQERRMARAAGELGAAVEVMETSTDKILKSAEIIDDNAKTLGTSLKSDYEAGLAHDIQDQLTAIYEACNFQDIAGQRIGKVIGTLGQIDEALTQMLVRCHGLLGGEAVPAAPATPRNGCSMGRASTATAATPARPKSTRCSARRFPSEAETGSPVGPRVGNPARPPRRCSANRQDWCLARIA